MRGSKPITTQKALADARVAVPGDEASLEAEVLLMHALRIDRVRLYQRLDEPMTGEESADYAALIGRRRAHEPLAYITGHREFFGLAFEVTPAVLIPRPETETLVEQVLAFVHARTDRASALSKGSGEGANTPLIADIGTGSGVIAVSLAHSLPTAHITATDISSDALALAGSNAQHHSVSDRIDFRLGDLFSSVDAPVHIIAANPPYVTTAQLESSPPEIRDHEPRLALYGGKDGLDVVRRLLAEAPAHLIDNGALFCEIGDWQGDAVRELASAAFPGARIEIAKDLAGRDRVLCVYR